MRRIRPGLDRGLFITGLLLLISEIWKQWCLTFVVNGGVYQWWYFPFQLCSLPMYLALIFPWMKKKEIGGAILTFLMDSSLLGSIMVWADQSGLHYPLAALTVHSYLWHIVLMAVGIVAGLSREADRSRAGFVHGTLIYGTGCLAASLINYFCNDMGEINMFYINPTCPVTQPVFRQIAAYLGRIPAIYIYMGATVLGAGVLHWVWRRIKIT